MSDQIALDPKRDGICPICGGTDIRIKFADKPDSISWCPDCMKGVSKSGIAVDMNIFESAQQQRNEIMHLRNVEPRKTVYVLRVSEDSTRMILGDKDELLKAISQEIDDTEDAGVMPDDEGGMTLLIHSEQWRQSKWDAFEERTKEEDFPGW